VVLGAALLLGCGAPGPTSPPLTVVKDRAIDAPLRASNDEEKERFAEGDALFDLPFREADGLGPLYIRTACSSCHQSGLAGPGGVQKMVLVTEDGITPAEDQSALPYGHTVRPFYAAGARTAISVPPQQHLKLSSRLGPVVLGRGYLEAIADEEIVRAAAAQEGTEVSGRVHRVRYVSEPNPGTPFHQHVKGQDNLIGRFGFKARVATLDEFSADAFQGDMGMTSPLRPVELPNPDGLSDDKHPGPDVDLETVNAVADYLRLLEIPLRSPASSEGARLFLQTGCAACHVPSLKTRSDYPIAALAGVDAPVYSDLLLHDMGVALADGQVEGQAGPREWRTAPLIGVGLVRDLLHDGRAHSVEEAVLLHASEGSEANATVSRFRALSEADRQALLLFVEAL
jgi:CxxC motif-containing protein (DUF1111 family)